MKKTKEMNISVDCYEFVIQRLNKDLFGDEKDFVISPKLMSKWWWIYLLAPILGSLLFAASYYVFNQSPNIFWVSFGIGEIASVWLAIYGITIITSKKKRRNRILLGIVLILVMFFPVNMAIKFKEATSSIPLLASNYILFIVLYSIIFIVICGITVTFTRLQILYSELTKLFGPTIPATFGRFPSHIKTKVDKILEEEVGSYIEHQREYEAIKQQAQAIVDSASTLVLPWVTVLTIIAAFSIISDFSTSFIELFSSDLSILGDGAINFIETLHVGSWLQLLVIAFGIMATLGVTRQVFMNATIIQSIARLSLKD